MLSEASSPCAARSVISPTVCKPAEARTFRRAARVAYANRLRAGRSQRQRKQVRPVIYGGEGVIRGQQIATARRAGKLDRAGIVRHYVSIGIDDRNRDVEGHARRDV